MQTLDASDEFRIKMTEQLLAKLFSMGVTNTKTSLAKSEAVSVSAFCRYDRSPFTRKGHEMLGFIMHSVMGRISASLPTMLSDVSPGVVPNIITALCI